ncbi:MAG: hypothetical protein CMG62_00735 [Candidatus Marinimicrobia bacterium]|nr:hypothetical protein [Candidatus Neomarinimicrobiota bacterium]|tara:strand:- start:5356 stop:5706 length:351 start_codon:yes stop_codon:yes gene_type:complete
MLSPIFLIPFVIFSCSTSPLPTPKKIIMPPTKTSRPDLIKENVYSRGFLTAYDVWEFLRLSPSEIEVLDMFGLPDSVWLDERETTKFLYYYINQMKDYNTIEISAKTDSVSGFEWD